MPRPPRFVDQVLGKALAEAYRGCGLWPLQNHFCELEPPFDPYDPYTVTPWDCYVNEWDAPWESSRINRLMPYQPIDVWKGLELPPLMIFSKEDVWRLSVARFPEDEATLAKGEQLLRSLPHLTRPVAFEIVGLGPQPEYDSELLGKILQERITSGKRIDSDEAIRGWRPPKIVTQFAGVKADLRRLERLLLAHYPNSAVVLDRAFDSDPMDEVSVANEGYIASMALEGGVCFPLRTLAARTGPDPLAVPISAMDHLGKEQWAVVQILIQRAQSPWERLLRAALADPNVPNEMLLDDVNERVLASKFASPLYAVSMHLAASTKSVFRQLLGWVTQFSSPPQELICNQREWENGEISHEERWQLSRSLDVRLPSRPGMLLNCQELCALVHLPNASVVSQRLETVKTRTRPAPPPQTPAGVVLGENVHRGKRCLAIIPEEHRRLHCYVAGATGTGKSTFLLNSILQDIEAGHGAGLLDPHGDLIKDVLCRIPSHRVDDVILFNPADREYPFALNIFEARGEQERDRVIAEFLMALQRYFPSSWGPRLERILTFTLLTVMEVIPHPTLDDVERMLTNHTFRRQISSKITTRRLIDFWDHEFRDNTVDPVLNKISVFLTNNTVRNIVCQRGARFDFDQVLAGRKIFLANLSTGLLSESISGTLGSFLVTKIINSAFRRANLPQSQRTPFYLYVDEFQNFMQGSVGFDRILAEARKYGLVLAGMANQYVGQLSAEVKQAVFGNVGTMVIFRVGVEDANAVARQLGVFTAEEILNLDRGEAIARVGPAHTAFNLMTYPPPPRAERDPTAHIISRTRRQYARPRAEIVAELNREEEPAPEWQPPSQPSKDSHSKTKATRKRRRQRNQSPAKPPSKDPNEDDLIN